MTDTAVAPTPAPAPPPPPATPAPPAPAHSADSSDGSLLAGVQATTTTTEGDAAKPFAERVPEKYRVVGEDGAFDLAASAEKIEAARASLESKLGNAASLPPATPEDYKIEAPNGEDGQPLLDEEGLKAFTGDPLFQNFQKEAHAKGITNEQLQFVVDRYLNVAPQLIAADKQITKDEASRELSVLWKDESTFNTNLKGAMRAVTGFGAEAEDVPGSRARLMEKFGNDPDFLAFAASVAGEMKEDAHPNQAAMSSEADVEALQKSPAYWDKNHQDHARVKAQVDEFYIKKFGAKRR